jgi:hypothetical protein
LVPRRHGRYFAARLVYERRAELQAPYRGLPDPWPDRAIEPGMPVKLDQRELEAVVEGVIKWMKDPASVSFAGLSSAKKTGTAS